LKNVKQTFLIVKLGAIGDVVMALPILTYIKKSYPKAKIFWICGSAVLPILKATSLVDQIIIGDENKIAKGNLFVKLREIFKIWSKIGFKIFDVIITAYSDPRYRLLTLFNIGKKRNSFFQWFGRRKLIYGRYMADEYVRLISKDAFAEGKMPDIELPAVEHLFNRGKDKVMALALGGSSGPSDDSLRRWSLENYLSLAYKLKEKGITVVLTGLKIQDERFADFVNLIDKTSLLELVSIYKQCDIVITHDCGSFHLAKLAKVNVLGLFGPTIPTSRYREDGKTKIIWGGDHLACRPCYDGKCYANCSDNRCMKAISVEEVLKNIFG
jgi:heptosyltransferase-2